MTHKRHANDAQTYNNTSNEYTWIVADAANYYSYEYSRDHRVQLKHL